MKRAERRRVPVYLASGSPRRRQLLGEAGVCLEVVGSAHQERIRKDLSPRRNAERNALGKCRRAVISSGVRRGCVIGADTLIDFDGRVIGKPKSRTAAKKCLTAFSGRSHRVITGVALRSLETGCEKVFSVVSTVRFKNWDSASIEAYLDLGTYADKAGAYAYQDGRHSPVRSVRGSGSNVVGLPMERTLCELKKLRRSGLTGGPNRLSARLR